MLFTALFATTIICCRQLQIGRFLRQITFLFSTGGKSDTLSSRQEKSMKLKRESPMKKAFLIIVVLVFAAGLTLWIMGKDTREIRTEIEISAPVAEVWSILTNIDEWSEWSPIINRSSGKASLGSALNITMMSKEEGKDGPKYNPVVTIFDEPNSFRWRAKMMAEFVFTNDKVFELEETTVGTRLVHKELFSGMMVPMFWSSVEKEVPSMLNSMNEALKAKAEKNKK